MWGLTPKGPLTPLQQSPSHLGLRAWPSRSPGSPRGGSVASRPQNGRQGPERPPPLPVPPMPKASPSAPAMLWPQHPTHNSRVRHSPKGVDFPEKDSEAPHVRLGGEFLPCGWEKWSQIPGVCGGRGDPGPPSTTPQALGEARFTFSLRASGAVHLTGSLPVSWVLEASLVRPKSLTLATLSSDTSTLRAARSRCTKLLPSRYSMASHTSLGESKTHVPSDRAPTAVQGPCRVSPPLHPAKGCCSTHSENLRRQSPPSTDRPLDRR